MYDFKTCPENIYLKTKDGEECSIKRHKNEETGGLIALSHKKTAEFSKELEEKLKKGYEENGFLNLELASEAVSLDNEALSVCEEKLMESE